MPSGRLQSVTSRPCQSEALHLVSGPFATPLLRARVRYAVVAQLVRAPVCGTGGRWFEPTQLYQQNQPLTSKSLHHRNRLAEAIAEICLWSFLNIRGQKLSRRDWRLPRTQILQA